MNKIYWINLSCLFILITLSSCFKEISSELDIQNSGTFVKFLGNSGNTEAFAIAEVNSGFMIVGTTAPPPGVRKELYLAKLTNEGALEWEFTSSNNIFQGSSDFKDVSSLEGRDIVRVGNRIFILTLVSLERNETEQNDLLLLEVSEDFGVDSTAMPIIHTIDGSNFNIANNRNIYLSKESSANLTSGTPELIILANANGDSEAIDMYLARWNFNHDSLTQERTFGILGKNDNIGNVLIEEESVVWCGTSNRLQTDSDLRAIKYNINGNLQWIYDSYKEDDKSNSTGQDIIQSDNINNFLVIGSSEKTSNTEDDSDFLDILITEVDNQGNFIQRDTINLNGNETGTAITSVEDGGFLVTGKSIINGSQQIFLLKLIREGVNVIQDPAFPTQLLGNTNPCESVGTGNIIPDDLGVQILALEDGYVLLTTVCFENNSTIGVFKTDVNGKIFGVNTVP